LSTLDAGGLLQLTKPPAHDESQTPLAHDLLITFVALQSRKQAPQFATFVLRFTSQPSPVEPLQSSNPPMQLMPQLPAEQVGVAFGLAGHTVPHPPQWLTLFCVLTHVLPHRTSGRTQFATQLPAVHTMPEPQELPQPPQFSGSF
jgi:hypothetical protein